jgi:2-oxoglutarate dehydrogenase E2 component (dihydrolipoamide succinyltransferase)
MPTSVTMPRLGESVTEGTVTRWLKAEGDHVEADEPLLEVSTDKVDTEVPSPASGTLLSIKVQEDETVEIGVELAVIGEAGEGGGDSGGGDSGGAQQEAEAAPAEQPAQQAAEQPADQPAQEPQQPEQQAAPAQQPEQQAAPAQQPEQEAAPAQQAEPAQDKQQPAAQAAPPAQAAQAAPPAQAPAPTTQWPPAAQAPGAAAQPPAGADEDDDEVVGTYVTPLVRKLASEHGVDLASLTGTGVGGRIRKSDVLQAAARGGQAPSTSAPSAPSAPSAAPAAASAPAQAQAPAAAAAPSAPAAAGATARADGPRRGSVEPMSRMRQVIAARMVESLQVSAQLTTVVEVDVTKIARLRDLAKREFEAREGVKLSFLPFFAVAAIEALKAHPVVNSSVDMEAKTITYHDAEHLGIAVDTDRGLLVPVIHDAGDLNLAGLARKIADLAERTRANKVSPDELGGGTFTLTNTGSRGALFDTPIINQPQVAILGTGAVVKRAVVIDDPDLGETIAVRSMVYLALSYDHRVVDGADAARFLVTVKQRLETGAFERALGLSS